MKVDLEDFSSIPSQCIHPGQLTLSAPLLRKSSRCPCIPNPFCGQRDGIRLSASWKITPIIRSTTLIRWAVMGLSRLGILNTILALPAGH